MNAAAVGLEVTLEGFLDSPKRQLVPWNLMGFKQPRFAGLRPGVELVTCEARFVKKVHLAHMQHADEAE